MFIPKLSSIRKLRNIHLSLLLFSKWYAPVCDRGLQNMINSSHKLPVKQGAFGWTLNTIYLYTNFGQSSLRKIKYGVQTWTYTLWLKYFLSFIYRKDRKYNMKVRMTKIMKGLKARLYRILKGVRCNSKIWQSKDTVWAVF